MKYGQGASIAFWLVNGFTHVSPRFCNTWVASPSDGGRRSRPERRPAPVRWSARRPAGEAGRNGGRPSGGVPVLSPTGSGHRPRAVGGSAVTGAVCAGSDVVRRTGPGSRRAARTAAPSSTAATVRAGTMPRV